jgi:hypothetical protein
MAIPAEFSDFRNEDDFVQRFLIPLLFRLGFSVVANYHGKRENGKDVIFADIDRFGHILFFGLQAKFEPSIPKSMVLEMVDDVESAFGNPFTHPQTNKQEVITRFYYVNAGTFSEYVPDDFFNRIGRWKAHTVILDGPGLIALGRWATLNKTTMIRELLSGLILVLQRDFVTNPPVVPGCVCDGADRRRDSASAYTAYAPRPLGA